MKLQWKASLSATCMHSVACFRDGLPIADDQLADAIVQPIEQFCAEIVACELVVDDLLPVLLALAGEVENNRQLVEMACTKLWGRDAIGDTILNHLSGAVADLEAALSRLRPKLAEELTVRARPLREQWEGRGPGLLRQVARLSEDVLIAEQATVVLVAPFVGGHGWAHLSNNRVTFEAVLTHPHAELPETLRLAWLLSQLNLDLPMLSERVPAGQLQQVAPLATLPLVLAAATEVELAQLDATTLRLALECWHLPTSLPDDVDERLLRWWQTYEAGSTRWAVALTALAQMLAD